MLPPFLFAAKRKAVVNELMWHRIKRTLSALYLSRLYIFRHPAYNLYNLTKNPTAKGRIRNGG